MILGKDGDTMATAAQIRAKDKYRAKTYDRIELQVPKGTRDRWRALAEREGKSLTAYIVSRVESESGTPGSVESPSEPPESPPLP